MPTYSTAVRRTDEQIVLELEIRVEAGCVELGLAVEAISNAHPISGGFRHVFVGVVSISAGSSWFGGSSGWHMQQC